MTVPQSGQTAEFFEASMAPGETAEMLSTADADVALS